MQNASRNNLNTFLTGTGTAMTANMRGGGVPAAPMIPSTYIGYRIAVAPQAVDHTDTRDEAARLAMLRSAFYRMLALIGATTPDMNQATVVDADEWGRWATWIVSLGHLTLAAPVMDNEVAAGIIDLPAQARDALYRASHTFMAAAVPDRAQFVTDLAAIQATLHLPPMHAAQPNQIAIIEAIGGPTERAALYALVAYLLGRPYALSATAISVRRPANLEAKGNRGLPWGSISGPLKMSIGTVKRVSIKFEMDPKFRAACFFPLIGLGGALSDVNINMISTMVGLLPMSQMNHVKILADFVNTYPFVVDMPSLAAEFYELARSVQVWNNYPADVRPFAKLIYRDQFKGFDSKRLIRLVRLAVDKMALTNATLRAYAVNGADQALVAEFDALMAVHMPAAALPAAAPGPAAGAAPAVNP